MLRIIPVLIFVWVLTVGLRDSLLPDPVSNLDYQIETGRYTVSEIISPNLIRLEDGETIRLLGVALVSDDSDETNQMAKKLDIDPSWYSSYHYKIQNYLTRTIGGRAIGLRFDPRLSFKKNRDENGNLYAYVFYEPPNNGVFNREWCATNPNRSTITCDADSKTFFLNAMLIQNGYAHYEDTKYIEYGRLFKELETNAKLVGKGIWLKRDDNSLLRKNPVSMTVIKSGIQCEENMEERADFYQKYFKSHMMKVDNFMVASSGGISCAACGCPSDAQISVQINPEALDQFVEIGFEPES